MFRWRLMTWSALVLISLYAVLQATAWPFGLAALCLLATGVALAAAGERIAGERRQPNIAAIVAALAVMRAAGWLPSLLDPLHIGIDCIVGSFALWSLFVIGRRAGRRDHGASSASAGQSLGQGRQVE